MQKFPVKVIASTVAKKDAKISTTPEHYKISVIGSGIVL